MALLKINPEDTISDVIIRMSLITKKLGVEIIDLGGGEYEIMKSRFKDIDEVDLQMEKLTVTPFAQWFDVILLESGNQKLKEAKDLVDCAPSTIKEGISKEEAESLKKNLVDAGAKVEIRLGNPF